MAFGDTTTPGFVEDQPFPACDWQQSGVDGASCAPLDGQLPEFTKPEFQADEASTLEDPLSLLQGGWVPLEELDGSVPTGDLETHSGDPLTGECQVLNPEFIECWFYIPPHEVVWLPLDDLGLAEDTSEAWTEDAAEVINTDPSELWIEDPAYTDQVSDPASLPTQNDSTSPVDGTGDLDQSGDFLEDGSEADGSDPTTDENVLIDVSWTGTGEECIPFEAPEPWIGDLPLLEECYLPIDLCMDPLVDGGSEEPLPYWRGGDPELGAPMPYWRTVTAVEQDSTGEPVLYALDGVVEPEPFSDPQVCYFSVGVQGDSLPEAVSGPEEVLLTSDPTAAPSSSQSVLEPAAELPTEPVPEPAADLLVSPVDAETDSDFLASLLDLSQSGSTGVDAPQAWRDLDPAALITSR